VRAKIKVDRLGRRATRPLVVDVPFSEDDLERAKSDPKLAEQIEAKARRINTLIESFAVQHGAMRGGVSIWGDAKSIGKVSSRRASRPETSVRRDRPGGTASWRDAQGRRAGTGGTPG
jgi:hypothetical protein